MAYLPETATYEAGIYQLETVDQVLGGSGGISNTPNKQLANRTAYLKGVADNHETRVTVLENSGFQGVTNAIISGLAVTQSGAGGGLTVHIAAGLVVTMTDGYDANGLERRKTLKTTSPLSVLCPSPGFVVLRYDGSILELVHVQDVEITAKRPTQITPWLWHDYVLNTCETNVGTGTLGQCYACVIAQVLEEQYSVRPYPYRVGLFDNATPAGTITAFAGERTPHGGWIAAEGNTITIDTHPNLYWWLYDFGGPTSGAIALPDLRGEFIRGWDNGRLVDTGRTFGTAQAGQVGSHLHTVPTEASGTAGNANYLLRGTGAGTLTALDTSSTGGAETRPRNIALRYWIKL